MNNIDGTEGDDTLTGTPSSDAIRGHGGDDILIGGDGDDTLDGGSGDDRMEGGAGYDRYYVDSANDVVIEAVTGVLDELHTTVSYVLAAGSEVELLFAEGTAAINLTANEFDNHLYGNNGANVLDGGSGRDVLEGYGGDDILKGGDDTDGLFGGSGADTLIGGKGDDALVGGEGNDLLDGGEGEDIADYSDAKAGVVVDLRLSTQDTGAAGIDTFISIEGLGGSEYSDQLTGDQFDNRISGWGADDILIAGAGDDRVYGGTGNDTLFGGSGADQLTGNEGYDTFIGTIAELSGDLIWDFSRGDRIVITDANLDGFTFGINGSLNFTGGYIRLGGSLSATALKATAAPEGGVEISFTSPPIVISASSPVVLVDHLFG